MTFIDKSNCCDAYPESKFSESGVVSICMNCGNECETYELQLCRGKGCNSEYSSPRNDAYGLPTGSYCDDCYENNYPYRKDKYPTIGYHGYGERLDDNF